MNLKDEKNLSKVLSIILNITIVFGIALTGGVFYITFYKRGIQDIVINKG